MQGRNIDSVFRERKTTEKEKLSADASLEPEVSGGGIKSHVFGLNLKKYSFQLRSHSFRNRMATVFCCVCIIVFGIASLTRATPESIVTSIGENISTNSLSLTGAVTSGSWLGNIIDIAHGGTGLNLSSIVRGSLLFFSDTGVLSTLNPGNAGQVLTSGGTDADPSWQKVTRSATFVVAASDSAESSKKQADYVCDGTDDQVEIQAAIDALPAGGGKVSLLEGTFNISSSITISRHGVWLQGSGRMDNIKGGSVLKALNNLTILNLTYTTSDFTKLEDLVINGYSTSSNTAIGIAINEADDVSIYNTYITNNYYGVYINGDATNPTLSFNFIEGNAYGVYGVETAGVLKILNNVAGYNTVSDIVLLNLHFKYVIQGNEFKSINGPALSLNSCQFGTITGNVFAALSVQPQINIFSTSEYSYSTNNSIIGNTFDDRGYASPFVKIDATTDNIIVTDNNIYKTGSDSKIIVANGQNIHGIISRNIGYLTENSGASTITASQTSITVAHGLASTPTRVQLTPTTATGVDYWISNKTATTFTINLSAVAVSDISFDWRATVGEGN